MLSGEALSATAIAERVAEMAAAAAAGSTQRLGSRSPTRSVTWARHSSSMSRPSRRGRARASSAARVRRRPRAALRLPRRRRARSSWSASGWPRSSPAPIPMRPPPRQRGTGATQRRAWFEGDWLQAEVVTGQPPSGTEIEGPAVLELAETTLVVPPGARPRSTAAGRPDHARGGGRRWRLTRSACRSWSAACARSVRRWAPC